MKALELEEAVSTIDDSPHRTSLSSRRRRRRPRWVTAIAAVLLLVPLWVALPEEYSKWPFQFYESEAQEDELILGSTNGSSAHSSENIVLPQILMEEEIYDESNFINAEGIAPPYWNTSTELFQNSNAWGPCFKTEAKINWQFYSNETRIDSNTSTWNVPLVYERDDISKPHDWQNTAGLCRPGFLILGAGKCGTSSLYHYLVGHPRVLPAVEKQIHYFKVSACLQTGEPFLTTANHLTAISLLVVPHKQAYWMVLFVVPDYRNVPRKWCAHDGRSESGLSALPAGGPTNIQFSSGNKNDYLGSQSN